MSISKAAENLGPENSAGVHLGKMAHLKFIPQKVTNAYYVYAGSQTQPPCKPLNWIVPKVTFDVTQEQVNQLQKCVDHKGHDIKKNVRDIQA